MTIHVAGTGTLRGVFAAAVEVPPGTSLGALCARIATTAEARRQLFAADGGLEPTLIVVVNGRAVAAADRAALVLGDGDEVVLMPPIAGG